MRLQKFFISLLTGFLLAYVFNALNPVFSFAFLIKAVSLSVLCYFGIKDSFKFDNVTFIGSLILSVLLAIGKASADYVNINWLMIPVYIIMSLPGYYLILTFIFNFFIKMEDSKLFKFFESSKVRFWFMLLCWLPYLLAFWPGLVQVDTAIGVLNLAKNTPSMHGSITYAALIYVMIDLPMMLGVSLFHSVLICSVCHMLFMSYFINKCIEISDVKQNKKLFVFIYLFFCLLPFFGMFAENICKDGPYAVLFVYLLLGLRNNKISKQKAITIGLLLCLLRSNTVYVFILWLVYNFFFNHKKHVVIFALCIVFTYVSNFSIKAFTKATDDGLRESVSVCLQQMSYVYAKTDYFSKEEREFLESKLDYNSWIYYTPGNTDAAKYPFSNDEFDREFWQLYLKTAKDNPSAFIKAIVFLNRNSYYPDGIINVYANTPYKSYDYLRHYEKTPEPEDLISFNEKDLFDNDGRLIDIHPVFPWLNERLREFSRKIGVELVPVVSKLFSAGFYVQLFFTAMFYALYKKDMDTFSYLVPGFVLWLTLMIAPCVLFRYYLPYVFGAPFLVYYLLDKEEDLNGQEQ